MFTFSTQLKQCFKVVCITSSIITVIIANISRAFSKTAAAKSLQLCLTLCDPIDSSPPGSPVPGILQARTLEWVATSFSKAWKWKVKVKSLSRVRLWVTPWTAAYQASLSMGFSRQEYWSGLPLPSPFLLLSAKQFTDQLGGLHFEEDHLVCIHILCEIPTFNILIVSKLLNMGGCEYVSFLLWK